MSTGSGHEQFPEQEVDVPAGGAAEVEPAPQRAVKRRTLQSLEDAAGELARAMGLPVPREQSQREALILAARRTLNAPNLRGINLKAPEWDSHPEELDELLAAGVALSAVRSEFGTVLEPRMDQQSPTRTGTSAIRHPTSGAGTAGFAGTRS